MPLDRAKAVQAAEKFLKAGKLPEAITEYKKLAEDNPRDMNVFNKLGDLCVRVGKNQDAIRYFLRIADFYSSDGFFLKAIAMYKKVSKLDPSNMDCLQKLAGLYLKQGLTIEAKAQFVEVADHFVKGAQFKKAIEILPRVLEIEPDNLKIRISYADLLHRAGQPQDAAREYAQVARDLAAKGMVDEAMKVGQKGLKVAPGNADLMSLMLSLSKEAQKSPDELLAAVVEMAKGTGDNPRSLALLGEAYLTAGKSAEAEKIFKKLGHMGDGAPAEVLAAMARYHISKDADEAALGWASKAADRLVEGSRAGEAASLLDEFLRAFPEQRGGLAKRAEVAEKAGDRKAQATSLYKLAQILAGASDFASAGDIVKRLKQLDPENPRFDELLKSLEARAAGGSSHAPPRRPLAEAALPTIEIEEGIALDESPVLEVEGGAEEPAPGEEPVLEEAEEEAEYGPDSKIQEMQEAEDDEVDDDFVSEHFTEAEVFVKYGLLEKAKQQLLGILAKHPKHVASHTKLKEIYYEEGNKEKAVEECMTLSEIFKAKNRPEEAREMVNEAVRIDPNNPRVKQSAAAGSAPSVKPAAPAPAAPKPPARPTAPPKAPPKATAPAPPELVIEETTEVESIQIGDAEGEADAGDAIEIELTPEPLSSPPKSAGRPAVAAKPVAAPAAPSASRRPIPEKIEEETPDDMETGGLSFGDISGGDEITVEIEEEAPSIPLTPAEAPRTAASVDPDSEKLGEVDFYIDQGLLEEARAVLFQLQKQYPESGELAKRFERANRPPQEKPVVAPAAPAEEATGLDLDVERAFGRPEVARAREGPQATPKAQKAKAVFKVETAQPEPEGDFFDLASELDKSLAEAQVAVDTQEQQSLDSPGHSLEEIFRAFKKGVEQQVDSEDYDTHYNLGIAYKEMGLVDEAIGEFQFAAKDPNRTVECCGILGLCFREKGMPDLALKWYKRGLDAPDLEEQEAVGLRYDIAEVHREQGNHGKALQLYTEVFGMDSTYRDVAAKVKEMRKLVG
jgi:tetratricopeptide (TPR) repeat protein